MLRDRTSLFSKREVTIYSMGLRLSRSEHVQHPCPLPKRLYLSSLYTVGKCFTLSHTKVHPIIGFVKTRRVHFVRSLFGVCITDQMKSFVFS